MSRKPSALEMMRTARDHRERETLASSPEHQAAARRARDADWAEREMVAMRAGYNAIVMVAGSKYGDTVFAKLRHDAVEGARRSILDAMKAKRSRPGEYVNVDILTDYALFLAPDELESALLQKISAGISEHAMATGYLGGAAVAAGKAHLVRVRLSVPAFAVEVWADPDIAARERLRG